MLSIKYEVQDVTLRYLRKLKKPKQIYDLGKLCLEVENRVSLLCEELTYLYAWYLFKSAPQIMCVNTIYNESNKRFRIARSEKRYTENKMIIDIMPVDEDNGKTEKREVAFTVKGLYSSIDINIHDSLKPHGDYRFEELYKSLFDTAYQWYRGILFQCIDERDKSADAISGSIYGHLRSLFAEKDLQTQIQLVVLGPDYGFRLLDRALTNGILGRLDASPIKGYSANEMMSVVACGLMPTKECLMIKTFKNKMPLNGEINTAKYSMNGTVYSETLRFMYPADAFRMHPIYVDEGGISIVAAYPVGSLCDTIEPRLTKADSLKDHIKSKLNCFNDLYINSTKQETPPINANKNSKAAKEEKVMPKQSIAGNAKFYAPVIFNTQFYEASENDNLLQQIDVLVRRIYALEEIEEEQKTNLVSIINEAKEAQDDSQAQTSKIKFTAFLQGLGKVSEKVLTVFSKLVTVGKFFGIDEKFFQ
jgi:hypothetical protein